MGKYIIIIFSLALFASCSGDLGGLNKNLKDPASVSGESLFTGAQKALADQIVHVNVNVNNTKLWAQYLQQTTYTDESNYDLGRGIPGRHWRQMYREVLKDLDESSKVISATEYSLPAEKEKKENKLAIIEILKVYAYANLVETFGDVPYSESLDIENLLPKYDDGETVYKDLLMRLSEAINKLDLSKGSYGNADNMYQGDVALWKKFAASLKLRMGILLSDVDATIARSAVSEAVESGVISSNVENGLFTYYSSSPNNNPMHNELVLSGRSDFVAGKTIVDAMLAFNDPRIESFFTPTSDGSYQGGVIGSGSKFSNYSHVADDLQLPTTKGVLFSYSEVEFLLAEAAARGFDVGGTAKSHYDSAVKASFEEWSKSSAVDDYLKQSNVDYEQAILSSTAEEPWKEVIGTQKWIALFNRGMEAWTSIRLLDYPKMAEPTEAVSKFPLRYTYPIIEQTLNKESWKAASANLDGGDNVEAKLWWDIK